MNYYEILAKCGHVGRKYYYPSKFYVEAEDGKIAAAIVRQRPRVKKDHKDAILHVFKISYEQYKRGLSMRSQDPYNQCKNQQ